MSRREQAQAEQVSQVRRRPSAAERQDEPAASERGAAQPGAAALRPERVLQLQRAGGNRAAGKLLAGSARRELIQRTSAEELHLEGSNWLGKVWIGNDTGERDKIIERVNKLLKGVGFTVGRGFQPYDPVVRPARKYTAIAVDLDKNSAHYAKLFLQFYQGQKTLEQLPKVLQELCIIVFFAEIGRGYSSTLTTLAAYVQEIADGNDTWSSVKVEFAPSLTYGEDAKMEWTQ